MKNSRMLLAVLGAALCGAGCSRAAVVAPDGGKDVAPEVGAVMPFPLENAPYHGVYRKGAASKDGGPPGNVAVAKWLNRSTLWAEDFEPNGSWEDIAGHDWQLRPWSDWKKEAVNRRLILSVPLLPGPKDLSGPKSGRGAGQAVSLEAGARGEYNAYFKTLAQNLVKWNLADSVLRMAWEFNGTWATAYAGNNPAAFAGYWQQVVTTMRAVPGTKQLQFCWNPTSGSAKFPVEAAWPGDDFVDVIGLDVYDQSWQPETYPLPADASATELETRRRNAWEHILSEPYGLTFWRDFGVLHHKPLAFPEWGVDNRPDHHSGGDNVLFVEQMHAFIVNPANHVYFHSYFDVEAHDGHHQLSAGTDQKHVTEFPLAAARFKALFGNPEVQPTDNKSS